MSTSVQTPWVLPFAIAVILVRDVPSGRNCVSERTLRGYQYSRNVLGVEC